MSRAPAPTDLTDAEWAVLQSLIPPAIPGGRPREVDMREVLNAAFYVHHCGGGWRRLPLSFPPWQTVYTYVRAWKQDGNWERMLRALENMTGHGDADDAPQEAILAAL